MKFSRRNVAFNVDFHEIYCFEKNMKIKSIDNKFNTQLLDSLGPASILDTFFCAYMENYNTKTCSVKLPEISIKISSGN